MKDWGGLRVGAVWPKVLPEFGPDCLGVIWLGKHAPELRR